MGIHNPLGTQAPDSLPLLSFADEKKDPGDRIPGLGVDGGVGEFLLAPSLFLELVVGPAWNGIDPSMVHLDIPPPRPALLGARIFLQGRLLDNHPRPRAPLGPSEALEALHGRCSGFASEVALLILATFSVGDKNRARVERSGPATILIGYLRANWLRLGYSGDRVA